MTFLSEWWSWFGLQSWQFRLIVGLAALLVVISVSLFIVVLRMRQKRLLVQARSEKLMEWLEPKILDLIYDDEGSFEREIAYIRSELNLRMYHFHSYGKVSDYLMALRKNMEGDSSETINRIYRELDLPVRTLKMLKEAPWHQKVKALSALGDFGIREYLFEVLQYANHKERLVRDEAQFAAVRLGGLRAVKSIGNLKYTMSKWQQLRLIEECAKLPDTIKEPVLSWMNSENDSLVELSARLCIRMDWYEVLYYTPTLVKHKRVEIRMLAIEALRKLGTSELLPEIIRRYEVEERSVQRLILKSVGDLDENGDYLNFLRGEVMYAEPELALEAAHSLYELLDEEQWQKAMEDMSERRPYFEHVMYA